MSESKQRQTGNIVGGNAVQRTDAERAEQIVELSEITGNLTQEALSTKKEQIQSVLKEVLAAIEHLGLKEDEKEELQAQAETAQAQMKAKNPKPTIITESLKNIWETLKGAATSAAASGAGMLVKELMAKIAGFLN